jgi:hypothetical protein
MVTGCRKPSLINVTEHQLAGATQRGNKRAPAISASEVWGDDVNVAYVLTNPLRSKRGSGGHQQQQAMQQHQHTTRTTARSGSSKTCTNATVKESS